MTATQDDVYRQLGYLADDLRTANKRLTEIRTMLAAGAMTRASLETSRCPHCPVELGPRQLQEHLRNVHGQEHE